jgi:hypothetical protein
MVVACLAEVAQDMGSPIAGYVDVILLLPIFLSNFWIINGVYKNILLIFETLCHTLQRVMPMVLKELVSSEGTNRRNAAFCVGELCKNGGESTLKYPS